MSLVASVLLWRYFKPFEEVLCELASGVPVPKQFGFVETCAELSHNRRGVVANIKILSLNQRSRGLQHGLVGKCVRLRVIPVVHLKLAFEHEPLGVREVKLCDG